MHLHGSSLGVLFYLPMLTFGCGILHNLFYLSIDGADSISVSVLIVLLQSTNSFLWVLLSSIVLYMSCGEKHGVS